MAKSAKPVERPPQSKTSIGIFPFDLFGGGGAARGAELLADALREMVADNRREELPTRARAYQMQLALREFRFEKLADYQQWRVRARRYIHRIFSQQQFLLWVGGNHLGVLPVYEELGAHFPETLVIQLDAHLDIYNLSDCTSELSHGNFLLHTATPLPPLVNVGHRELLLRPDYIGGYFRAHFPAEQLVTQPELVLRHLRDLGKTAPRVFLDVDCDVLDSAYFPALAHPQPFGLSPQLLLRVIDSVWSERVIGIALSEFDPARDQQDRSLSLLMWLIEYLLLRRYEGSPGY